MDTRIKQLDKPTVQYIRKRIEAATKPLAKELGVAIDLGSCTFQTGNCRFQLKVAVLDPDGKAVTEEADSFRRSARLFGFESADLGREFIFQGQPYTICGFKPKSRKYPVMNIARIVYDAYPHSDLLPIDPDRDCRDLQSLLARVTGENIGDGLFTFMVVEIVEGGESTLAGAIRVLEQARVDVEAVLRALRDASTDQTRRDS